MHQISHFRQGLQPEQLLSCAVEYFFTLFAGQGQFVEALHFFVGGPHGVIGGVHNAICTVEADYFDSTLWGDGEQGATCVDVHVFVGDELGGRRAFPFAVAAQMCAYGDEVWEQLHNVIHAFGTGVIIAVIAGVDEQRQTTGDGGDHLEHMGSVDLKVLNIRVYFDALETGCDDIVHYFWDIFYIGMHCCEGNDALGIFCVGFQNKIVYALHLRGGSGYRMSNESFHTGAVHFTQRGGELAVHAHGNIIEFSHCVRSFFSDFVGENMYVEIDDVHLYHLF